MSVCCSSQFNIIYSKPGYDVHAFSVGRYYIGNLDIPQPSSSEIFRGGPVVPKNVGIGGSRGSATGLCIIVYSILLYTRIYTAR